ncbi:MAG: hypothetical protein ABIP90_06495, partial [Vicinamibacterales bacterium]
KGRTVRDSRRRPHGRRRFGHGSACSSLRSSGFESFQIPAAGCRSANHPRLREVVSGNFRIVYRRRAVLVEIATVFRGSRDFSSRGL